MIQRMLILLAMAFVACAPRVAKANGVIGNFVICDTCVQDSDFAQAARIWYGTKTTRLQITVGNPSTGVLYTMWVVAGRGSPAMAVENSLEGSSGEAIAVLGPSNNIVRADQLALAASAGSPSVSEESENTQWEPVFNAQVNAHKNSILFYVTDSMVQQYGDSLMSFQQAGQEPVVVSDMILAEETSVNGTYLNATWSLMGALQNALDSYYGKGILATVIFKNGDVATYQLNILDPNATRPVKGTAKDRFGHALPDDAKSIGGSSSGSSESAARVSWGGADITGYGMGSDSSETLMVCSFVGGVLQGCYQTTERTD